MLEAEQLRPLVLLELRRQRPVLLRLLVISAFVTAVFYALGKRTPMDQLAILLGSSVGIVALVPVGITRDKLEGTLDFLLGLPIEPRTIVASRFVATAITAVPWALIAGLLSLTAPPAFGLNPLAAASMAWLLFVLLGFCGIAVMARFDLETLAGAPFIAFAVLFGFGPRVVRMILPNLTAKTLFALLLQPFAPAIFVAALLVAIAAVGATAFSIAERALANLTSPRAVP